MQSEKRIALVTGATAGIGEAIAHGLAGHGLRVLVAGRDARRGEEVARTLGDARFVRLDVTRSEDIDAVEGVVADGIDVLVNNAGASFSGFDAEVARRTLDVNFVGTMRLTDRLLPRLRPHARVVMVTSGMADVNVLSKRLRDVVTSPTLDREALLAFAQRFVDDVAGGRHSANGWPSNAYRVSKIAMDAYVRLLARELAHDPRNILVNAADPGWVRTAMGGPSATRSPEEGARTPIRLALLEDGGLSGGLFRDGLLVAW